MWMDITETQKAHLVNDLDRYFLLCCKAQDIFNKMNGYGLHYVLTYIEGQDVELYIYSFVPEYEYESRTFWDCKTGELKKFLQKEVKKG